MVIYLYYCHLVQFQLSKKYGPVYSIKIGVEKMVILCGYETVRDALVNHADEFSGRPLIPLFDEFSKGHGNINFSRCDIFCYFLDFYLSFFALC